MAKRIVVAKDPESKEVILVVKDHITLNLDRANAKFELVLASGKYTFFYKDLKLDRVQGNLKLRCPGYELLMFTSNTYSVNVSNAKIVVTNSRVSQMNIVLHFLQWYGGCLIDSISEFKEAVFGDAGNFKLAKVVNQSDGTSKLTLFYKNLAVDPSISYNGDYKIFESGFKHGDFIWYTSPINFNQPFRFSDITLAPILESLPVEVISLYNSELCSTKDSPEGYIMV